MANRRHFMQSIGVAAAAQLAGSAAQAADSVAARNKEIIRQYFARCWNNGDVNFGETIIVNNYDLHLNDGPGGFTTWRFGVMGFQSVFKDLRFENLDFIAEGDLVAVRSVFRGIHVREFMGVPPSGRAIAVRNADFYRLKNGKMVAHWDVTDFFNLLQQIGGLPDSVLKGVPPVMIRGPWPADAVG